MSASCSAMLRRYTFVFQEKIYSFNHEEKLDKILFI